MASSSGTICSGSTLMQSMTGSEEDLKAMMELKKRKRMISNRESARRSRMKKQKHLDNLISQVTHLRKENKHIITSVNITTQHYLNIEAENSVLKARVGELSHRLQSLDEILTFLNASNGVFGAGDSSSFTEPYDSLLNPLNLQYLNQPIMAAAADMFQR